MCIRDRGLGGCLRDPGSTLSVGMQRRVSIARAVLYDPPLLALDEAFKGLDADTRLRAMEYVRAHSQGLSLIHIFRLRKKLLRRSLQALMVTRISQARS